MFYSLHHSFVSGRCFVLQKYKKFSIKLHFKIKNRLAISGKWRPALGLLKIVNDSPSITSGLRFQKDNKVFHNTRVKIINTICVLYHMVTIPPRLLTFFVVPRESKTLGKAVTCSITICEETHTDLRVKVSYDKPKLGYFDKFSQNPLISVSWKSVYWFPSC